MARLGKPAAPPKAIPWRKPFLLAAALMTVVLFVDRFPEWRSGALRPDPEGFAPQPTEAAMEREIPGTRMNEARRTPKKTVRKKRETLTQAKKAPASQGSGSFDSNLGEDARRDNKDLGMAAADRVMEDKAEEAAPSLPVAQAAKPAAAPAEGERTQGALNTVILSRQVTGRSWKGPGGEAADRQELITDAETFGRYWRALAKGPEPAIDFSTEAVLLFFTGTQPGPGQGIAIGRIEEKEDSLQVRYRIDPPEGTAAPQEHASWSMQVIPKPSKPVTFIREE
jgi:hypothetical protein